MYLSPLVSDGIVYAATFDNDVYALDASSGRVIRHNVIPGNRSELLQLADGLLYLSANVLHALDADTGELVWRFPEGDGGGPYLSYDWSWAEEEPFFTVGGEVVCYSSASGEVFALDTATGQPRWKFQTVSGLPAAPAVSGDVVLLGSLGVVPHPIDATASAGVLYAVDAETGQLTRHFPTIVRSDHVAPSGATLRVSRRSDRPRLGRVQIVG